MIILLSGIVITFFIARHQYAPGIITIGSVVPDIELSGINEKRIRLSDMKGSVVFINFWATWCKSCVDEMPSMENLYLHLSGNNKFKLMTILYRDDKDMALRFMKENGYTFPVYLNPDNSAVKQLGITGVPETFIIDKNGVLRDKIIGPAKWDSPVVVETLLNLINEK